MKYFHSWSGGKDSTAAIILDHIHGLPPSTVVFCEVMLASCLAGATTPWLPQLAPPVPKWP